MNHPKSTRKTYIHPVLGTTPSRIGPNHHRRFRQPKGYYDQKTDVRHLQPRSVPARRFPSTITTLESFAEMSSPSPLAASAVQQPQD